MWVAVRQWFKQETVLTVIMITVTTLLIIGATVAWFVGRKPVTILNNYYQAGGIDGFDVKVAIVPDSEQSNGVTDLNMEEIEGVPYYTMNEINANQKEIDIDLAKLSNIEEGKLGPGSYGNIRFKIQTITNSEMKYVIRITPNIKVAQGIPETSNDGSISKEMLLDLVQNHIKFYAVKDENQVDPNNIYSEVIPYYDENQNIDIIQSGFIGTVPENNTDGTIQYVTIYWYWPYEYTDIPGYDVEDYSSTIYNPWNNANGVISYEGKYSNEEYPEIESRIEAYDWDDTKIGNCVSSLQFHFEVSSYQQ